MTKTKADKNLAIEASASLADALRFPIDIPPSELFERVGRAIEQLIDLLDRADAFYDEREQQVDDGPGDGDDDSEESRGSINAADQTRWASGEAGDREGDEEQHGGDGAIEDNEPSLGWTEEEAGRGGAGGSFMGNRADFEDAPSTVTAAALARYRQFDRYSDNNDGWHVDSEHWFGDRRRLRNLSDRQRRLVRRKIDRNQVSC